MFEAHAVSGNGARLLIKICGITNADDANAAIDYGADALGFNCYSGSKRYIDIFRAGAWLVAIPGNIHRIAVTVNPTFEEALVIAGAPGIDALQLHGQETPQFCRKLAAAGVRVGKALPATERLGLSAAALLDVSTVVLDSSVAGAFGGTGITFPWEIAAEFVRKHPQLRVILAGGLDVTNVAAAIRAVRPFGVDVTTGVESAPGRKDHRLVRDFISAARAA